MNRCLTPMGRRLLRASILQPPCDERLIADRQSCVAELVANHSLGFSLQVVARSLHRPVFIVLMFKIILNTISRRLFRWLDGNLRPLVIGLKTILNKIGL